MKKIEVLLAVVFFCVLFFWFLATVFEDVRFEAPQYELGPFHTPIQTWCSKSGVEYLVTRDSVSLHVDPAGKPVSCQRAL